MSARLWGLLAEYEKSLHLPATTNSSTETFLTAQATHTLSVQATPLAAQETNSGPVESIVQGQQWFLDKLFYSCTEDSDGDNGAALPRCTKKCSVCLEDLLDTAFPAEELHGGSKTHVSSCCSSCWQEHIQVSVNNGRGTTVGCADGGCRRKLTEQDMSRLADRKTYDKSDQSTYRLLAEPLY
jgi:hypothetical protein